jgi:hypothetical protein
MYVYIQWSSVQIQTPRLWSLISHNMIAPLTVLLSSSKFLPAPLHCTFIPARKNLACIAKFFVSLFLNILFKNCVSLKLHDLKWHMSWSGACEAVDCFLLTQDIIQWGTVMNMGMSFRFSQNSGICCPADKL